MSMSMPMYLPHSEQEPEGQEVAVVQTQLAQAMGMVVPDQLVLTL